MQLLPGYCQNKIGDPLIGIMPITVTSVCWMILDACHLLIFFQNNQQQKINSETLSECQMF